MSTLFPGAIVVLVVVGFLLALAAIAWPTTWLVSRQADEEGDGDGRSREAGPPARYATASIVVAVALATAMYRALHAGGLQQTAALFIGIPAIIAVVVVLYVRPASAGGVALKATTLGLLVSLMFLDEGMLCVWLSAPLFYFIALLIAAALRPETATDTPGRRRVMSGLVGLAILPMSLEGVTTVTSFSRESSVTVTRIVAATPSEVERALRVQPRFDRERPRLLRIGFPWPEASAIDDRPGRAVWAIRMRGGEMRLTGMEPRTGTLRLELDEARHGLTRWTAVADDSHMRHFLTWLGSEVRYEAAGDGHTHVSWTVRYRRDLDPAWYFGPMERYAVTLAAGYLIDAVATP